MDNIKNDKNLRGAVNRREQQLAPMPADLNERLMQRLEETELAQPETKQKRLWVYAAVAVAASIALLVVFNFGKQSTPQEPLVAQTVEQPTTPVSESVEEPSTTVSEPVEALAPQPSHKPAKKQRKVVMQLVELIPTSETASANVKTLPASLIDKVKAYDKQSDLSRMTGIDDTEAFVARTMDIDEDPLVAMAAQLEDIRSRGQRLQQEITAIMNN